MHRLTTVKRINSYLKAFAIILAIAAFLLQFVFSADTYAQSSEVSKRIEHVKKDFPNKSKFNITIKLVNDITGSSSYSGANYGSCDGLVAYTTLKVFHNPFYSPDKGNYKQIGKTARGNSKKALKSLFKKAKKGDVIYIQDKNGNEFHVAIFLSYNSKGVRVYEANSRGKNKVWYNYQWNWNYLKTGWKGKAYYSIYRSKNYNQVNKGNTVGYYKKGTKFTINGITYKVTKPGMRNAKVKVVSKESSGNKVPKAVGLNPLQTDRFREKIDKKGWSNSRLDDLLDGIEYRTYKKDKKWFYDEQYYVVEK